MDGHIFIQRKGDIEAITKYKEGLRGLSLDELTAKYNGAEKLGFVGSHQQARYIIAIHQEFLKRIKQSPIKIEDNILISFKGEIKAIIYGEIEYETSIYKSLSTIELIERYNTEYKRGFLGIMMQRGYIIELGKEFYRRFKDTPLKNNIFKGVSFKGEIKTIINNTIYYERH